MHGIFGRSTDENSNTAPYTYPHMLFIRAGRGVIDSSVIGWWTGGWNAVKQLVEGDQMLLHNSIWPEVNQLHTTFWLEADLTARTSEIPLLKHRRTTDDRTVDGTSDESTTVRRRAVVPHLICYPLLIVLSVLSAPVL